MTSADLIPGDHTTPADALEQAIRTQASAHSASQASLRAEPAPAGPPGLTSAEAFDQAARMPLPNLPVVPDGDRKEITASRVQALFARLPNANGVDSTTLDRGLGGLRPPPTILVFVSFSMPDRTLKNYLEDASRIGASLVLRGLVDDDLLATQHAIRDLVGKGAVDREGAGFLIDPTLYTRFGIEQAPTILVTETPVAPCNELECPTPSHIKLAGDVSLAWALERIAAEAPALAPALGPAIFDLERGRE
jgi:type-F conjugative transfer system pilin assembly protein TrbC